MAQSETDSDSSRAFHGYRNRLQDISSDDEEEMSVRWQAIASIHRDRLVNVGWSPANEAHQQEFFGFINNYWYRGLLPPLMQLSETSSSMTTTPDESCCPASSECTGSGMTTSGYSPNMEHISVDTSSSSGSCDCSNPSDENSPGHPAPDPDPVPTGAAVKREVVDGCDIKPEDMKVEIENHLPSVAEPMDEDYFGGSESETGHVSVAEANKSTDHPGLTDSHAEGSIVRRPEDPSKAHKAPAKEDSHADDDDIAMDCRHDSLPSSDDRGQLEPPQSEDSHPDSTTVDNRSDEPLVRGSKDANDDTEQGSSGQSGSDEHDSSSSKPDDSLDDFYKSSDESVTGEFVGNRKEDTGCQPKDDKVTDSEPGSSAQAQAGRTKKKTSVVKRKTKKRKGKSKSQLLVSKNHKGYVTVRELPKEIPNYTLYLAKLNKLLSRNSFPLTLSMMTVMVLNSFVNDMFNKIAREAEHLVMNSGKKTLNARDLDYAAKLVLPGLLGQRARLFAWERVGQYDKSQKSDTVNEASPPKRHKPEPS